MMNYAVVLNDGYFTCLKQDEENWRLEQLNGEESLVCSREEQLLEALSELGARLNYTPPDYLIVLYSVSSRWMLASLLERLGSQQVILLPLEAWLDATRQCEPALLLSEVYYRHLLPLLCQQVFLHPRNIKLRQLQEVSNQDTALVKQLHSEQQENLALREELNRLHMTMQQQANDFEKYRQEQPALLNRTDPLDVHAVAQFMPLFFPHFWQRVSASDFALLLGTLDVPMVGSPYPEPDRTILVMKKRDFLQQKYHHQQQIRAMVLRFVDTGSFSLRPEAELLMDPKPHQAV